MFEKLKIDSFKREAKYYREKIDKAENSVSKAREFVDHFQLDNRGFEH